MKTRFPLKSTTLLLVPIIIIVLSIGCDKEQIAENTPVVETKLDLDNNYQYSATNNEAAIVGRVLFYDKSLSLNNSVACGSCHLQSKAFADDSQFSEGIDGQMTTRNTPPLQNLQSQFIGFPSPNPTQQEVSLFWDGRFSDLKSGSIAPIFNHAEMGIRSTQDLVAIVSSKGYYKELFKNAFGNEEIDLGKISTAMESFVGSITSGNSRFEQTSFGFENMLTSEEQEGMDLFFTKYDCAACHQLHSSNGYGSSLDNVNMVNIGLDVEYSDQGKGSISKNSADDGKFKIPNLRNITNTSPYMHDGRFTKLDEVIEHYNSNLANHPNLDEKLLDDQGQPKKMGITAIEKQKLIAFLGSLSDQESLNHPKFSNPFVN